MTGATTGSGHGRRPRALALIGVVVVLAAALLYPLLVAPAIFGTATTTTATLVGLAAMWCVAAAAIAYVTRVERRPLASIGVARISRAHVLQALAIGIALSLTVPVLSLLAATVLPASPDGSIAAATRIPWWLMLLAVVSAAVTEEIVFRGYALERLLAWTGSRWLASAIALACFTAIHAGGWNAAHVVGVVLPLGVALTLLYWWRRSVPFVIIVHAAVNMPLVVMSLGQP